MSARALAPMRLRVAGSKSSVRSFCVRSPKSPGVKRKPFSPSWMTSGMPPARAPTAGTPEAMASMATKPSVSVSEGNAKTSELA